MDDIGEWRVIYCNLPVEVTAEYSVLVFSTDQNANIEIKIVIVV